MTYQRPHNRPRNPLADDMIRKDNVARRDAELAARNSEEAGIRAMPIIVTLLAMLAVGYFLYAMLMPRMSVDTPRTTDNSAPRTVTPPPAPAAPVPNPQTK